LASVAQRFCPPSSPALTAEGTQHELSPLGRDFPGARSGDCCPDRHPVVGRGICRIARARPRHSGRAQKIGAALNPKHPQPKNARAYRLARPLLSGRALAELVPAASHTLKCLESLSP